MVKARNQNQVTSAKASATPMTAVQAIIAEQLYDLQGRPAYSTDIAVKVKGESTDPKSALYPNQIGFEAGFITERNPTSADGNSFWSTQGGTMAGQITSWVDQTVYSDEANQQHAYSGRYYEADPTSRTDITSAPGSPFQASTPQALRYAYGQYDTLPGANKGYSPPPQSSDITSILNIALNDPDNQSKNAYQTMVTRIPLSSAQPEDGSPSPALYQISMNEIAGGAGFNLSIDTKNNSLLSNTQYTVNSMLGAAGHHIVRTIQHNFPNYYDSTHNILDSDKASFQMKTEIDALGRTTYSKGPDDQGKRVYYDDGGLLRFSQDADQAQFMTCLYYVYDGMGRLIRISGLKLTTIWNATILQGYVDNPSSMLDTKDLRIYTYDATSNSNTGRAVNNGLGRLVQVDSWNCPMDLNKSNSYNYANSKVREIYSYDNRGRLAQRQLYYMDQSSDQNGLQNVDSFSYTYNNLSQVTRIAGSLDDDYTVNYQYNLQGLLSSVSDASNPTNTYVQYVYNADGTLNSNVMPLTGYQTSYSYNTIKQLTDILLIRSSDNSRTFDELLSYSKNGSYGDGNLTSAYSSYNNPIGAQNFVYNYTYDSFKRLASAIASPANNSTNVMPSWNIVDTDTIKGYDSNGNIYNSSQSSAPSQYNLGTNQLNNMNNASSSYFYTPSGRVSSMNPNITMSANPIQNLKFTYDILLGRPISISSYDNNTNINYNTIIIYDAAGERIFKSTNNMTIQYYRNGPQVLYEQLSYHMDQPVDYIANYYYGLSGIVGGTYKRSGDTSLSIYNSIVDHLGSTRLIIDPNNTAITYFNYDTWGNLVTSVEGQGGNSSDGAGQESPALYAGVTRYLYTGQEWDAETQLYNYHARQYDPSSYRFLTPDPMYRYTNPYTYVANNPVNFVDPSGMILEIFGDLQATTGFRTRVANLIDRNIEDLHFAEVSSSSNTTSRLRLQNLPAMGPEGSPTAYRLLQEIHSSPLTASMEYDPADIQTSPIHKASEQFLPNKKYNTVTKMSPYRTVQLPEFRLSPVKDNGELRSFAELRAGGVIKIASDPRIMTAHELLHARRFMTGKFVTGKAMIQVADATGTGFRWEQIDREEYYIIAMTDAMYDYGPSSNPNFPNMPNFSVGDLTKPINTFGFGDVIFGDAIAENQIRFELGLGFRAGYN